MYYGDDSFDTQTSSDELPPEYEPTAEDLAEAGEFFAQMNDDAVAQMSDDDWEFDWLFIQA